MEALPEHLKGEIIDGQLYVQARPRPRHARGIGFLARFLGGSFDYDEQGPGGWWIVDAVFTDEPEARIPPFDAIAIPLHRLWV